MDRNDAENSRCTPAERVALRKESVDRNPKAADLKNPKKPVALRKESVDRNQLPR